MISDAENRTLSKGQVINEVYEVDCFIGQGAFGEVYRVKHKYFDDYQTMKVFKDEYVQKVNLDTLINEGRILAKLTHPNIVRVFDVNSFVNQEKKYFYMTMSYVSGESLTQLMKRKISLPVSTAISIVTDILQGLNEAHSHNPIIIHRDINPDNILLSYDNERHIGLLCDFGLSVSLDRHVHLAGASGRYLYFAPECFMNCYLPCSDVFSIGIVLYKMITGLHPWDYDFENYSLDKEDDILSMINKGRRKAYRKPSFFNKDISDKLEHTINKALEFNMEKRYRTAGQMLMDVMENRPVSS
jgi:serine/threonine-protein kinase